MYRLLDNMSCDLDLKVNLKGQMMYFLINASPPKSFGVATLNFARA